MEQGKEIAEIQLVFPRAAMEELRPMLLLVNNDRDRLSGEQLARMATIQAATAFARKALNGEGSCGCPGCDHTFVDDGGSALAAVAVLTTPSLKTDDGHALAVLVGLCWDHAAEDDKDRTMANAVKAVQAIWPSAKRLPNSYHPPGHA